VYNKPNNYSATGALAPGPDQQQQQQPTQFVKLSFPHSKVTNTPSVRMLCTQKNIATPYIFVKTSHAYVLILLMICQVFFLSLSTANMRIGALQLTAVLRTITLPS
jgi:hypothetical protein